jgi:hypothetical protein
VTLAAADEIHVVPVSQDRMAFAIQLGMDCVEDAVSSLGTKMDQAVLHTSLGLMKLPAQLGPECELAMVLCICYGAVYL